MNRNVLLGMTVATALVAGIAVFLLQGRQATSGESEQALFPQLANAIPRLNRVVVEDLSDATAVTLQQQGDQWVVAEQDNYPASMPKLRTLIESLNEARLAERKTSKAENHGSLGVSDSGSDAGTLITLQGDADFSVIIGNTATRRNVSYARLPGDDQSWALSQQIAADTDPLDWLDKTIIDLPATDIARLTISNDPVVTLVADEDSFRLEDMPEGRELAYPSVGNTVAGALAGLQLENVQSLEDASIPEDALSTHFKTKQGMTVHARTWKTDDKAMVHLRAQAPAPSQDPPAMLAAEDSTEADPAAQAEQASQTAAKAAELDQQLAPWVFQIASYKFDNLQKTQESLLKTLPE